MFVLFDEEARRLWEEQETDADDDREGELKCDRDAVRASIIAVGRRVVDD